MRMHIFVYIFLTIWCVGVVIGLIAILISLFNKGKFNSVIFVPLGMLLFAYLLITIGFKSESSRSIKDLEKIFNDKFD